MSYQGDEQRMWETFPIIHTRSNTLLLAARILLLYSPQKEGQILSTPNNCICQVKLPIEQLYLIHFVLPTLFSVSPLYCDPFCQRC